MYSGGLYSNQVYIPYGVGQDGVVQIVDRTKLLDGCTDSRPKLRELSEPGRPALSAGQLHHDETLARGTYLDPDLRGPDPANTGELTTSPLAGTPQTWDLLAITSEQTANDCAPQDWKNP